MHASAVVIAFVLFVFFFMWVSLTGRVSMWWWVLGTGELPPSVQAELPRSVWVALG